MKKKYTLKDAMRGRQCARRSRRKPSISSKILLFMFFAAGIFLSGCAVDAPIAGKELVGIYPAANLGLGVEPITYKAKLGRKIKTTPVHPADSGFLSGGTATEPDSRNWDSLNWAPNAGLFGSIGTRDLRLIGGLSARWNLLHYEDDYHEGFYSTRQQVSDIRPKSQGSFVFTQIVPDAFTIIPSVGVEGRIGKLLMEASIGFPYMEWTARSGHDRWGFWETVQHDSWRGFGTRYSGTLGYDFNDNDMLSVTVFCEEYQPEFAGESAEISGIGGFINLIHRW